MGRAWLWGGALLLLAGCNRPDAQQEQAKAVIVVLARSEQAYFVEKGKFTDQVDALAVSWFKPLQQTPDYRFSLHPIGEQSVQLVAQSTRPLGKHVVAWVTHQNTPENSFRSLFCLGASALPPIAPRENPMECPTGFQSFEPSPPAN